MKRHWCTILLALLAFPAFCQTDSLFRAAQRQAYHSQYEQASTTLSQLLELEPEHYDARFLSAMVQAWDGNYFVALQQLNTLTRCCAPTEEALVAIARINLWAEEYPKAIAEADKGLLVFPDNEDLLYIRAQAEAAYQAYEDALNTLDTLLHENDEYPKAEELQEEIEILKRKNAAGLEYKYSRFSNTFAPWHQLSANYQRKLQNMLLIGRLQHAQMFDQQGLQFEIDAYPKFDSKTYAYLNAGLSNNTIFPKVRWGAEIFRILPAQWEASAGMRGLYFEQTPIHIYTLQLGHYFPAYWLSGRVFMSTLENESPLSGLLTARRYLGNKDHYATLYVGSGATPNRVNSLTEVQRLNANWIGIDYQHPLQKRLWIIRSAVEFQQETYPEVRTTDRLSFTIYLERRF